MPAAQYRVVSQAFQADFLARQRRNGLLPQGNERQGASTPTLCARIMSVLILSDFSRAVEFESHWTVNRTRRARGQAPPLNTFSFARCPIPDPIARSMPRRDDLKKILIIGSGPIVIGQACEFDYSGTQACKALREEGYEVVLVNSNPATIMTDPATADRTYIEPLTWEIVAKVIEKERPDALLPTLGGQTGLNVAMDLWRHGVLEKFGVEMIGANADVIDKAESRDRFQAGDAARSASICPRARRCATVEEARDWLEEIGLPAVVRPSFTLGGSGSAIAFNRADFDQLVGRGLDQSPVHQVLVEESIIGWKEYEMEVMRDKDDNVVIICSIENFDPMGIHTGDSITVAPAQTLTDKEYQRMRDASLAVIREIGVETGGSNIQFAIHPGTGRMIVIEMNPRVSRSSALASKATGFPIAKIAAKLAVGYRLHELPNDITRETTACFEPTIDYVVTKVPRFAFEKFPEADPHAHDADEKRRRDDGHRQHVQGIVPEGAARAGSAQRRLRLRPARSVGHRPSSRARTRSSRKLMKPGAERVWYLRYAFKSGMSVAKSARADGHRPVVLGQPARDRRDGRGAAASSAAARLAGGASADPTDLLRTAKRQGFSDRAARAHLRHDRNGRAGRAAAARDSRDVQIGRHLRGRVRGVHAVLLLDVRRRRRSAAAKPARATKRDHHSRRRAQPHRPGHRVRLLLLPRQLRAARSWASSR